jgi:signal transduction histidine kinase
LGPHLEVLRSLLSAVLNPHENARISTVYESPGAVKTAKEINDLLDVIATAAAHAQHGAAPETNNVPRDIQFSRARALRDLGDSLAEHDGNIEACFKKITECAAAQLEVSRCSLWLYSNDRNSIQCADLYTREDGQHTSGHELLAQDYPSYFEAIASERIIVANNAHTSPQTGEFSEAYLTPLNIKAMLDAPIRFAGKLVGVVCNEQTDTLRIWSVADQTFAASIGDFAAQALEAAKLAESRDALVRTQRIAHIGNWSLNHQTSGFTCSFEMKRILGYDENHALLKLEDFTEHIAAHQVVRLHDAMALCSGGNESVKVEFELNTTEGVQRSIACVVRPHFDLANNLESIKATCQDVTELRLMRSADSARALAEKAILALQQNQTALTSTLSSLVHDVRTPLTSIKLGLARLMDTRTEPRAIIPAMRSEVEYLDALFANLIALVRMDMDNTRLASSEIDLGAILEQVQYRFQFLAEDNQISLELGLPEESVVFLGDTVGLQQGLGNIVHNAIKFAHANVAITLYLDNNKTIIEVRDDGPGFITSEMSRVRDRYFSGQLKPKVGRFGTGLGLTIADDVISRMQGQLQISNHPAGGGIVQAILPGRKDREQPSATVADEA